MGAMILVVASTALFVYKYFEDKEHDEKWKDYEECRYTVNNRQL